MEDKNTPNIEQLLKDAGYSRQCGGPLSIRDSDASAKFIADKIVSVKNLGALVEFPNQEGQPTIIVIDGPLKEPDRFFMTIYTPEGHKYIAYNITR